MSAPLALRGSEGISMVYGPPQLGSAPSFVGDDNNNCKAMCYSEDGSYFAWCNPESLHIVETSTFQTVHEIEHAKVSQMKFSPQSSILATWTPYTVDQTTKAGNKNLFLWNVKTGSLAKSFIQKKQTNWCPQWSSDDGICARNVNNELQFFEDNNFDAIKTKLHLQKVSDYSIAQCPKPYTVAAYVPGSKGQPSYVRVYRYPNFGGQTAAIANKSFFKAERIALYWNKAGTGLLILTSTESSDSSYYGEQGLHFTGTSGESCLVPLAKNGPIYSIDWNPNSQEFCVVYGYMPSKATVYNLKCEPLFDFGTGPRNHNWYNSHGNILCLAGFGNLSGNLEFWDMKQKKLICQTKAPDSTVFMWHPDGEHFVTATCSPRLRVGNCYKMWHYTGTTLSHCPTTQGKELWEVCWQPAPPGVYPEKPIRYRPVESVEGVQQPTGKVAAYRPPSLRDKPASKPLDELEPPSNMKAVDPDKPLSKNQKKRAAKKAKAGDEKDNQVMTAVAPASVHPAAHSLSAGDVISTDPETMKKIKSVKKKLQQIEKLKEQQKSGKPLEINQMEKLKTESALLQELEELSLG